ncbi:MAG: SAM-dependent methyltransferase [Egibacteraceae bacterium]
MTEERLAPAGIDVRTPHAARVYDYALGGKDNFASDRGLVDKLRGLIPAAPLVARENRAFLSRAVHYLAAEAGIRQFLDVGSGLPTQGNVHEIAQKVAPDTRIVYVDYDPVVLVHGRALLSGAENATIIQGDVRQPGAILEHPAVAKLIDFDEPLALLFVGLFHLVADDDDPAGLVAHFREVLAPGSHLALCHITGDYQSSEAVAQWVNVFGSMAEPMVPRPFDQVKALFEGFDLVDPGLVKASEWRPHLPGAVGPAPKSRWLLAGVGRKT